MVANVRFHLLLGARAPLAHGTRKVLHIVVAHHVHIALVLGDEALRTVCAAVRPLVDALVRVTVVAQKPLGLERLAARLAHVARVGRRPSSQAQVHAVVVHLERLRQIVELGATVDLAAVHRGQVVGIWMLAAVRLVCVPLGERGVAGGTGERLEAAMLTQMRCDAVPIVEDLAADVAFVARRRVDEWFGGCRWWRFCLGWFSISGGSLCSEGTLVGIGLNVDNTRLLFLELTFFFRVWRIICFGVNLKM